MVRYGLRCNAGAAQAQIMEIEGWAVQENFDGTIAAFTPKCLGPPAAPAKKASCRQQQPNLLQKGFPFSLKTDKLYSFGEHCFFATFIKD